MAVIPLDYLRELHVKYILALLAVSGVLTACDRGDSNKPAETDVTGVKQPSERASDVNSMQFVEVKGEVAPLDDTLSMLQTQIILDRAGFSPGVIDGKPGQTLELAIREFQTANGIDPTGKPDTATTEALNKLTVPATRLVRIPAAFAKMAFVPEFPDKAGDQAKLSALGYRNMMEALAERFHTTPETLIALNSAETSVAAGSVIRVPNIADVELAVVENDERGWAGTLHTLGVSSDQPQVAKVVVDKSDGVLRAFDANDKIIASFPATMGSSYDPLPLGNWTIKGVARNPEFNYNPKLFWDVSDSKEKLLLPPGPNGPVGVVWIDLSKPHYGIHGTSEPHTIGRAESHGCVRLSNWDAAKLAGMVKTGVKAVFQK